MLCLPHKITTSCIFRVFLRPLGSVALAILPDLPSMIFSNVLVFLLQKFWTESEYLSEVSASL